MKVLRFACVLTLVLVLVSGAGRKVAESQSATSSNSGVLGICSTDSIAALLSSRISRNDVEDIIKLRLAKCVGDLKGNPKADKCKPANAENMETLFNRLAACVALAQPPASPTSPPQTYNAAKPTFYVFAPGMIDGTSQSAVLRSVVDQLHQAVTSHHNKKGDAGALDTFDDTPWIVAHGDWALKDFNAQCAGDPNVVGGLLIDGLLQQSATENYLVWTNGWTRLNAEAELIACPSPGTGNLPQLVALQHGIEGGGYRNGFPFTVASSLASFFVQNDKPTTTATSAPVAAASASPSETQITTNTTSGASLALLLATVGSGLSTVTLPALNQNSQLNAASVRFSSSLMHELSRQCREAYTRLALAPVGDTIDTTTSIKNLSKLCAKLHSFSTED